jgi:putative intracellular protease/amidase
MIGSIREKACFGLTLCASLSLGACASEESGTRWVRDPSVAALRRDAGAVLFVMTAADEQELEDGAVRQTGYFLNEFYEAFRSVSAAGYQVAFASPRGKKPSIDPESLNPKYWEEHPDWLSEAQSLAATHPGLGAPLSLDEALAQSDQFRALVIPGGQGVMVDLLGDRSVHELVLRMAVDHRPVGLICHAPALLTRLPAKNPFAGREVTSVSWTEELFIETFVMGARAKDRKIGDQLEDRGFRHRAAFPGSAHAVRDCNLVTSQNPFSGGEFNVLFLAALADWGEGGHCG